MPAKAQQLISDKPQRAVLHSFLQTAMLLSLLTQTILHLFKSQLHCCNRILKRVTGKKLSLSNTLPSSAKTIIIIGTRGKISLYQTTGSAEEDRY
ncbi:MAG: hypothetical protein WDO71_15135 [Bacteroidota bacterium]